MSARPVCRTIIAPSGHRHEWRITAPVAPSGDGWVSTATCACGAIRRTTYGGPLLLSQPPVHTVACECGQHYISP